MTKKRSPDLHYKLFTNICMKKSWNKCSGSTVAWCVWTQSLYKPSSPMAWGSKMAKCKPLNTQHVKQRKQAMTAMQVPLALLPAHSSVQHGYMHCSPARLCLTSAVYRDFKLAPSSSPWDTARLHWDTKKCSLWNAKHLAFTECPKVGDSQPQAD